MDYGAILTRASQITWNYKVLWLFGVMATLGSGGGSGGSLNLRGDAASGNLPPDVQRFLESPEFGTLALCIACGAIVVAVIVFVLSMISRGALIGGVRLAHDNGRVSFGDAWSIGTRNFWRILGTNLLLLLPVIVFVCLIAALVIGTFGVGVICAIPLACLFVLVLIPLLIVAYNAQYAVVLEDYGVLDAYRRSWGVLTANLGHVVIMGLIVIVIGFVASLVIFLPFLVVVVPAALSLMGDSPNPGLLLVAGLGFVCYLPVAIALSGILDTWTTSVWTLTYRQLTGSAPAALAAAPPAVI